MSDQGLLEKSNRIFADLAKLASEELNSNGLKIEPSLIVERVVSPTQQVFVKNLNELLEFLLRKKMNFA